MKQIFILLLIASLFLSCSEKIKSIDFITLNKKEFNAQAFIIPPDSITARAKRSHDSCMGFAFDANAMLVQKKDSFFIGTIYNRQTMKTVNTLNSFGLSQARLASQFLIITSPCYEKTVMQLPLKSLLGTGFSLQLSNISKAMNEELNTAILASPDAEMQSGSWLYLDISDALKNMLDTSKSKEALQYKNNLLDTSNMVLTAVQSVMDVSFAVNTETDMSEALQNVLQNKPSVTSQDLHITMKLSYVNSRMFLLMFNGMFPVMGKFMKAVEK